MGYNLLINGVYWGYNPLTNHLLTSWDIQVHNQEETSKKHGPGDSSRDLFDFLSPSWRSLKKPLKGVTFSPSQKGHDRRMAKAVGSLFSAVFETFGISFYKRISSGIHWEPFFLFASFWMRWRLVIPLVLLSLMMIPKLSQVEMTFLVSQGSPTGTTISDELNDY